MSDLVPRSQLTKQGVKGVGAVAGGVALLVLAGGGLFGIIAGGILTIGGLALSGSRSERRTGVFVAVVGAATLATGILGRWIPAIPWLMRAAGLILLGGGVWSLVQFVANLRKRM